MDLSQQELPLTAYFAKGVKTSRSHSSSSNKTDPFVQSSSPSLSSTRKRQQEHSARTAPSVAAEAQLPTPASSAGKHVSLSGKRKATTKFLLVSPSATHSEDNAILPKDANAERLELEPSPSGSLSIQRHRFQDSVAQLGYPHPATPIVEQRKRQRTDEYDLQSSSNLCPHLKVAHIALATPSSTSRRNSEPIHDVEEQSPTEHSAHRTRPPGSDHNLSRLSDPVASHKITSPLRFSAQSLPQSRVGMTSSDLFQTRVTSAVSAFPRSNAQPVIALDVSTAPVPSSQSQYLLHVDATPKRKRTIRPIELISSSQPQEERELTLSMPPETFDSIVRRSFGKHTNALPVRSERKSRHTYTLESTPIASPVSSPAGASRALFTAEKDLDVLPSFCTPSTSRHKSMTPRKSPHRETVLPPILDDDSSTEPESQLDTIQMVDERRSPHLRHSPRTNQFSSSPKSRSQRSTKLIQAKILHGVRDESATEAESDSEILHCVAQISRKQARERRSRVASDDAPSRAVISPLVSPARSRITASIAGSTQSFMQEGAGLSAPPYTSSLCPPASVKLSRSAESVPSVVRDFVDMFEGHESYPADFPESLRF